jgi:hypothetical protein
MPTYIELAEFLSEQLKDEAVVAANPKLYDVKSLKFIEQLSAEREVAVPNDQRTAAAED